MRYGIWYEVCHWYLAATTVIISEEIIGVKVQRTLDKIVLTCNFHANTEKSGICLTSLERTPLFKHDVDVFLRTKQMIRSF